MSATTLSKTDRQFLRSVGIKVESNIVMALSKPVPNPEITPRAIRHSRHGVAMSAPTFIDERLPRDLQIDAEEDVSRKEFVTTAELMAKILQTVQQMSPKEKAEVYRHLQEHDGHDE